MPIVVVGAGVPAVLDPAASVVAVEETVLSVAEVAALQGDVIAGEQPAVKGRKRARVSGGRFKADDPATPADEAWAD